MCRERLLLLVRSGLNQLWVPWPFASDWELLCLNGVRDLHVHLCLPTFIWRCTFTEFDSELRSYASGIIPTPRRSVGMMETLGQSHNVCTGMCLARMLLCGTDPWQQFQPCVCQVAAQCTEFQDGSRAQLLPHSTLAFCVFDFPLMLSVSSHIKTISFPTPTPQPLLLI